MRQSRIFLAERDDILRERLQSLLLGQGFEVIASPNVTGLFRALRQKTRPALLIVNVSLETPGDGLELVQLCRRIDGELPVIMIATHSSEDLAGAALKAGVNAYCKPPFSHDEWLTRVRRCLSENKGGDSVTISEPMVRSPQL